ncbi:MAG: phosphoribosyltransferase [Patescibacteria group bacterium]
MNTHEEPRKIGITWDKYFSLLRQLIANIQASGFEPKQIVCIARGGLIPGDTLSRAFKAPLAVLSVASYPDGQMQQEAVMFSRDITSAKPLQRQSILLVDDLTENGTTLVKTLEWLCWWYSLDRNEVKTATIWHKAWSKFTPDFYAEFVGLDPNGTKPWIDQPQELFSRSLKP